MSEIIVLGRFQFWKDLFESIEITVDRTGSVELLNKTLLPKQAKCVSRATTIWKLVDKRLSATGEISFFRIISESK